MILPASHLHTMTIYLQQHITNCFQNDNIHFIRLYYSKGRNSVLMDVNSFSSTVAPIDNVYGTLGQVNAVTTQQYSALSKLKEEIEGAGSYTFFAPSNEAWDLLDTV